MKKDYESPEFELYKIQLLDNLLSISAQGEDDASAGDIVDPGGD